MKKQTPRIHSWVDTGEGVLGFAGYKAGMTHVMAIDNRKNSPTTGLEISIPVTIIETPPMIVACIRAYTQGYSGKDTFTDIWTPGASEDLKKRIKLPKEDGSENRDLETEVKNKLKKIEDNLDKIVDIRLIVHTQPRLTSLSKKVPDLMEMAIGGGSIKDKLEFSKGILGKEVNLSDGFSENSLIDVTAVTTGKGVQGQVKRWGTIIQPRKAGKGSRHIGSGGPWTPTRKTWCEPLPGQMGYHTRTEYNKSILKISKEGSEVTPRGDFLRYGPVNRDYVMIRGSVPGPAKRLIRLTHPRRPRGDVDFEITYISTNSKQGA